MRRLILFGMLAALAFPAAALKRVNVAQLEQILTNATAAHRDDDSILRIFGDLELTEQLNNAQRDRIDQKLHLGPKSALALQLLADQSAFLDVPVAGRPIAPPPDLETERRILDRARLYVDQTLLRLPDLIATRSTFRFDNSPQAIRQNEWPVRAGLHLVGSSTREITLQDDTVAPPVQSPGARTVNASATLSDPASRPEPGLRTNGEFGPFLALIMSDTTKGKIAFHHWEQTPTGQFAVFRYSVPRSASHYRVDYCCVVTKAGVNLRGGSRRPGNGPPPPTNLEDDPDTHFHRLPAYHGSLTIDPATGAILRITVQAELDIDLPVTRADILVEYGPVMIGDRRFICPLMSLALTQGLAGTNGPLGLPPDMQINEASFTDYHRLGSSVRIITGSAQVVPSATQPAPTAETTPEAQTSAPTPQ
ncbi:MAG: hypothetical protein ABSF28_05080 [Terracidiphilus sp.]|jgi:hypothetical protein